MSLSSVHQGRSGVQFVLRPCASFEELDQCVALQQQIWGSPELEVVPRNMFVLARALGGHVLAAWDSSGALAGYAMAIAALEPGGGSQRGTWMQSLAEGAPQSAEPVYRPQIDAVPARPYLHSHQVAVAAQYQNEGLGFALKLAQREEALSRGIQTMRWTFDPTMARNAYFNLQRLGATARTYLPNFYGSIGSRLQAGLPTDRLLAEWDLASEWVQRRSAREAEPGRTANGRIHLPPGLTAHSPDEDRPRRLQAELREQLTRAFSAGEELYGFEADGRGGGTYLLRPVSSNPAHVSSPDHPSALSDAAHNDTRNPAEEQLHA